MQAYRYAHILQYCASLVNAFCAVFFNPCVNFQCPCYFPETITDAKGKERSLHAEVRCAMNQRSKLERLCRNITRHAIADEWLACNQEGQVVLTLETCLNGIVKKTSAP